MKRRRDNSTGAGDNTCSITFRGHCFQKGLGCRKCSRGEVVSATAAIIRSGPYRSWDTVTAAATAIFATCSIVAAFAPYAPVANPEYPIGYRQRHARMVISEGPFSDAWGGPFRSTFGTSSCGFCGRNPNDFSTRGTSIDGFSKCRLSSASVVEQASTRDTATETSSSVSGGKKKASLGSSRSMIKQARAAKGKEAKVDSVSVSPSASAPSLAAAAESRKRDPPNLQRYYKTELLTAEEEYTLGMRVRLMVQCEAVHEGLSLTLERDPTLEEWAAACGYIGQSSGDITSQGIEEREERSIRPAGSTSMRQDRDPNMFVGNGLAGGAGVGRGNGRAKKAPPVKLGEFWDDSAAKFKKRQKTKKAPAGDHCNTAPDGDATSAPQDAVLVNKGTVRDFVDMMILGREAKQRMIQCNMRLAVSIAKRYRNVGVNIADLVQEGSIGLARAAEKFDPKRGFKFSTYASWYVSVLFFFFYYLIAENTCL